MKNITIEELIAVAAFVVVLMLTWTIPSLASDHAHRDWCAKHMCIQFPMEVRNGN